MSNRAKPKSFARGWEPDADPAAPVVHLALAPTLLLNASGHFFEDGGLTPIAPLAQFSDADSPNLGGGSLTVTLNQVFPENRMALVTAGTDIGLTGNTVTWQGVGIGTVGGGGFNALSLSVALNANATPAAVQALIRAIGWENIDQDPDTLFLEFTFVVTDDTGGAAQATRTTFLEREDDRTVIANLDGDVAAAIGGGAAVRLDQGSAVLATDVDTHNFDRGTLQVRITQNYVQGEDFISILNGNGVSVAAGIVTVNGTNIGSVNPASTGQSLFVELNAAATMETISILMNAFAYTNANGFTTSTLVREVQFMVGAIGVSPANAGIATTHVTVSPPASPPPPPPPSGVPEGPRLLIYNNQFPQDSVLSGDGLRLFTAGYDGQPQGYVRIYNAESGASLQEIRLGVNPVRLDVSLDGRYLFVVEGVGGFPVLTADVYRIDLQTGVITTFTYLRTGNESGFNDVACLDNGQVLLAMRSNVSPSDGHGRLLDPATGVFTDTGVIMPGPLERTPDGHQVAVNGVGFLYETSLGVTTHDASGSISSVKAVAHSENGLTAAVSRGAGIFIYDSQMNFVVRLTQYNPQFNFVDSLAFDETGAFLFVLDFPGGQIVQLSTADWSIVHAIPLGISHQFDSGGQLLVAPDLAYFTYIDQSGLVRVNNPFVSDAVQGTLGNDNLVGTAADDRLIGDTGADTMSGGAGNDIYFVDQNGDVVVEAIGGGSDTVRASASYVLTAGAEVERIQAASRYGTQELNLTGNEFAQSLIGNAGANVLDGGAGADVLAGGKGNDIYYVDTAGDQIIEAVGEGSDTVYASAGYALNAGAEVEILSTTSAAGTAALALIGNEFGQTIIGNAGANFLYGAGGVDTINGGAGDDVIIVDSDDVVIEAVSGGNDLVASVSNYALATGAEVEILSTTYGGGIATIALIGNEFGQTIIGNAGANFLYGVGGADILNGGAGDDVIIVDGDDQVVEAVGGGNDLVASVSNYLLAASVEVETLSTTNGGSNAPIALIGNEFGQTIIGNAGANFLYGVGGADILNGGAGDDVIIVDGDDVVIEAVGGGNDLVASVSNYLLAAGAEVETLSTTYGGGIATIALIGNEFGQTIIGNEGDNFLDGGGGADSLNGLGGNDTYIVDNAGDQVLEAAAGGNDLVAANASYVLNAGAEVETLSTVWSGGSGAYNLTGNEFGQTIIGNAGGNILNGGLGADTLQGLGGADTFAFTTALGGGNVDIISDFVAGTDRVALDDAVFTGIGAPGPLNPDAFVVGTQAADVSDRIIYDSATGQLLYDADGAGGIAAVLFATLSGAPALGAGDFTVI